MKIDFSILEQAERQYQATMTDENRAVRDPVATPFAMAMKMSGYVGVLRVGGCVELKQCPTCPSGKPSYATQYKKDGVTVLGCPYCQNITEQ